MSRAQLTGRRKVLGPSELLGQVQRFLVGQVLLKRGQILALLGDDMRPERL